MSAADLSLVATAAYTARTKRARLRVHRGGKRRRGRADLSVGRSSHEKRSDEPTTPLACLLLLRSWGGEESKVARLPCHTRLEKCPVSSRPVIYIRCRDVERTKKGDGDGGGGSIFRPLLRICIFFICVCWRYEIASGLGIDRFNQPFNSFFNYRIKDRDRKNE